MEAENSSGQKPKKQPILFQGLFEGVPKFKKKNKNSNDEDNSFNSTDVEDHHQPEPINSSHSSNGLEESSGNDNNELSIEEEASSEVVGITSSDEEVRPTGNLFEGKQVFIHKSVLDKNELIKRVKGEKGDIIYEPISDAYNIVHDDYAPPARFENCNFFSAQFLSESLNTGTLPENTDKYLIHARVEDISEATPSLSNQRKIQLRKSAKGTARTKLLGDRSKSALFPSEDAHRIPNTIHLAQCYQDMKKHNYRIQMQALAHSLGHGMTEDTLMGTRSRHPSNLTYTVGNGGRKKRQIYKNHMEAVKYLKKSLPFPGLKENLKHFENEWIKSGSESGTKPRFYNDDMYREVIRVISEELPAEGRPGKKVGEIIKILNIPDFTAEKLRNLFYNKWKSIILYVTTENGICNDLKGSLIPEDADDVDEDLFGNPSKWTVTTPVVNLEDVDEEEQEEEEEEEPSLFFTDGNESFYYREDQSIRDSGRAQLQRRSQTSSVSFRSPEAPTAASLLPDTVKQEESPPATEQHRAAAVLNEEEVSTTPRKRPLSSSDNDEQNAKTRRRMSSSDSSESLYHDAQSTLDGIDENGDTQFRQPDNVSIKTEESEFDTARYQEAFTSTQFRQPDSIKVKSEESQVSNTAAEEEIAFTQSENIKAEESSSDDQEEVEFEVSQSQEASLPSTQIPQMPFTNVVEDSQVDIKSESEQHSNDVENESPIIGAVDSATAVHSQTQHAQIPTETVAEDTGSFNSDTFEALFNKFSEIYPNENTEILAYCGFIFDRVTNFIATLHDDGSPPTGPEYFTDEELEQLDSMVKNSKNGGTQNDPFREFSHKDPKAIGILLQFFQLFNNNDDDDYDNEDNA